MVRQLADMHAQPAYWPVKIQLFTVFNDTATETCSLEGAVCVRQASASPLAVEYHIAVMLWPTGCPRGMPHGMGKQ